MALDVLFVLLGLVLLTFAADRLVLSAARLSRASGMSPILIGAVVVGLGTSLPEMLVSGVAAYRPGGLDLAVGNVVGSNVANLALVLGVSASLSPMIGQRPVLRREGVVMLVASLLFALFAVDGTFTAGEGYALLVALVVALALMVRWARADTASVDPVGAEVDEMIDSGEDIRPGKEMVFAVGSLVATLGGAQLLVTGAQGVAEALGVSQAVIGLTLVAIGTSLPELATAVAAARRNENDLVLGNILGSNLFNALGVAGIAAAVGGGVLESEFFPSLAIMVIVTLAAGGFALTRDRLERWEGAVLLAGYPVALFLIT